MSYLLLAFITVFGPSAQAQSCEPEVTINLVFKYDKPYELPATAKDIQVFEKLASGGKVVNLYLDKSASKEEILKKVKDAMGGARNVRFNYAGHGITTKGGEKTPSSAELLQQAKAYRSPELAQPSKKSKKSEKGWTAPYGDAKSDPLPTAEPQFKGGKFALSPPACQQCLETAKKACVKRLGSQVSKKGLKADQAFYLEDQVSYHCGTEEQPERQECYAKACITTEDMAQLFANRSVSGFIDACHSGHIGGLETPNFNFVVSAAGGKAPGGDEKTGGTLANILNSKDICTLDLDGNGEISNTEILGVHSLKQNLPSQMSSAQPLVVRSREVAGGCFIRPKNCGKNSEGSVSQNQNAPTAER